MSNGLAAIEAAGSEVKGPRAFDGDWRRLLHLSRLLATTDFRLRFFGSALGYLWQLMHPLMLFGILYVVFTHVVKLGNDVVYYPAALLLGIVLYLFLAESTGGSVRSLLDREPLVRKIQFPRLAIPVSIVLTSMFRLGLNLIAVFVFLFASGGTVHLSWLELPVLIVLLTLLSGGLAMLLSALFVFYRDVKPIWDVLLQVVFYGSQVFYPIEAVPSDTARKIIMMNPFSAILQQARHAVIDPSHLSAAQAIGGRVYLLIPGTILLVIVVSGYWYFSRQAPRVAEEL